MRKTNNCDTLIIYFLFENNKYEVYALIYDRIIIGAGLYGLYSANLCASKGERILLLEYDSETFSRATYINQARVHMGYHYPRSLSTAIKSAGYFERFLNDYSFCILQEFDQVYATSRNFSWTNANQFRKFCRDAHIRCDDIAPSRFFNEGMCDGAFLTHEFTYDALVLRDYFMAQTEKYSNIDILYNARIQDIYRDDRYYRIIMTDQTVFQTPFLLNATYASTNQIIDKVRNESFELFKIKYELCEIILCHVGPILKNVGITVMDGPFFSIMPFGMTGLHSLTSVTFTPHVTSYDYLPSFACQAASKGLCSPAQLYNCNLCPAKPESAWPYMSHMAHKYMRPELDFQYSHSLYSMKPILKNSEIDDSRPTVIRVFSTDPTFVSVLSGKINTVYDLDEVLFHDKK